MNTRQQIARWALVVLWMAVIFVFSADMGTDSSAKSNAVVDILRHCGITMDTDTLSFLVRKAGHAFVYLVLGILSLRAFHSTTISPGKSAVASVLLVGFYACSDELHQYFDPGRSAELRDVALDTAFGAIGIGWVWLVGRKTSS